MLASGIHGRDAIHTQKCRAWTGPDPRTVLYMPALVGLPLEVGIWIFGYAQADQRESLRIEIDDKPVKHRFDAAEGYADLALMRANPKRSFVKLTIHVDKTYAHDA